MAPDLLEFPLSTLPRPTQSCPHESTSSPLNNQNETLSLLDPGTVLFLEKLGATQIAGKIHEYKILPGTYERVLDILEVEDKELWKFITSELRYELYDDERIILKRSDRLHAMVCGLLSEEINASYKSVLEDQNHELDQSTKALINSIQPFWDSRVLVDIKKRITNKLHPDNQWGLSGAEPAGLILEIACTQSFNDVRKKAKKYFIGSKFQVRMVIAVHVDAEFGIGISIWEGRVGRVKGKKGQYWAMKAVKEQEQIEKEGGLSEEGYLAIELGCFGPLWKIKSFKRAEIHREVRIPYATIVGLVKRARVSENDSRCLDNGPSDKDMLFAESGDEIDFEEVFEDSEEE